MSVEPRELQRSFRDLDPREAARLARIINNAEGKQRSGSAVDTALDEVNRALDAHGIEALRHEGTWDSYYGDTVALYVNTGETYAPTVLYDIDSDTFEVTSWGDWYEAFERRQESEQTPNARRRETRASRAVDARMRSKVDLRKSKLPGTYPDLHEKLVLDLAKAIERSKDPDYSVVSWASQEQAQDYFNEHGFEKALDHLFSLRGEKERRLRKNSQGDDDSIPIANPGEAELYDAQYAHMHRRPTTLYRMWLGAYGTERVYVWADSFESAFETLVEWADDNAPGVLTTIDESDLRAAAEDLGVAWREDWPDWDDRDFGRVVESAEADLTLIGHTMLKHGTHIPSWEWGGDEVEQGSDEYERVKDRSLAESEEEHTPNPPPPLPPRRRPRRESALAGARRVRESYERTEKPFDPEAPRARGRRHHFAVNPSAVGIPHPDDNEVVRNAILEGTGYRIMLWETGDWDKYGKARLGYAFYAPGADEPLFAGEDYHASPLHSTNEDATLRGILGFLTLKPGDTDAEYFESYSKEQMDFARGPDVDELSMWGMEEEPDFRFVEVGEEPDEDEPTLSADPDAEDEIRAFAESRFPGVDFDSASEGSVVYEHGHWWVRVYDEDEERESTFSVVDTSRGLDLEEM